MEVPTAHLEHGVGFVVGVDVVVGDIIVWVYLDGLVPGVKRSSYHSTPDIGYPEVPKRDFRLFEVPTIGEIEAEFIVVGWEMEPSPAESDSKD